MALKKIYSTPISIIKTFFINFGEYSLFMFKTVKTIRYWKTYFEYTIEQIIKIGVQSIPIVILTSLFSGMVIAVNSAYQLRETYLPPGSTDYVGSIVGESVLIELTPMMTALVMTGKIGATITAELGTMRVTEQVDALESLSFDPLAFLVFPRIAATLIIFPIFMVIGNYCGIMGGLWTSTSEYSISAVPGLSSEEFIAGLRSSFRPWDATFGIIKGTVFGFAITSVACYKGFSIKGGAQEVGKATSDCVVISCMSIVILDFLLGMLLL